MKLKSGGQTYNYVRPYLYPKQAAFVDDKSRVVVVEAATKTGKTTAMLVWLLEQAFAGKPGQHFWWIAPFYGQATMAFDRVRHMLPLHLFKVNETEQTVSLVNGTTITFRSGEKPDTLYGEDVYACVMDEATRMREDAWIAVRTTLTATRGPVRIVGNVKGRRNWAYKMARKAEQKVDEPLIGYYRLTTYDAAEAGIYDVAEIERAKSDLPFPAFQELFLAIPSDDGGNPFDLQAIQDCVGPMSGGAPAVWGIDLAKSLDYTVLVALDAEGRCCRFHRWQGSWKSTINEIDQIVGKVPALVDATGVGDPIVEELQSRSATYEPFKFTMKSKQQLMEGLAVAIQSRAIKIPNNKFLLQELEAFEYQESRIGAVYSAPEGLHDDTVCALALAVKKLKLQETSQKGPIAVFAQDQPLEDEWASLLAGTVVIR